jgi:phosphoribosylanthranilate isomerase
VSDPARQPVRVGALRTVAGKICGLTRPEDAALAERHGAAYLGVILASGPRLLDLPRAAAVLGPRRCGVQRVGVFGAQPASEVAVIAETLDLDVLQLHGDPTPELVRALAAATGRTIWPVRRVRGDTLDEAARALAAAAGWLVLDALVPGRDGGTGVALDWHGLTAPLAALRGAAPGARIVLAGGLRPENVAEAIRLLSPDVVDVSSGVESAPGVKDPAAVQAFLAAAGVPQRPS